MCFHINKHGVIKMTYLFRQKFPIIAAIIAAFGILCLCGVLNNNEEPITGAMSIPVSGKTIVIDAGHGGFDAGASANGLEEKNINLSVAKYLEEYISQGGGIAVMTRDEDRSTADVDTDGKSAKKSDLENRKKLVETAEADVFVSVHMNKFPQEQYRGAQVFYSPQPQESKQLGEEIQASLKEILNDGNERQAKKAEGIFILKNTLVPSVIVECGFLSNPQEAALLKEESYRQKLAWGIYVGIVKFFNS